MLRKSKVGCRLWGSNLHVGTLQSVVHLVDLFDRGSRGVATAARHATARHATLAATLLVHLADDWRAGFLQIF